ncbi:MAG: T9SS type B sorting domain-containing protein [Flavobacterium sp.]
MKKIITIFLLLISFKNFSQDFLWANHFNGYNNEYLKKIVVDDLGNSYVLGTSASTIFDIDPTNGTQIIDNTINNTGTSLKGLFLCKFDTNGNYIWGITFNTFNYYDEAIDLKIGNDNYIYMLYKSKYYEQTFGQEVQCFGIKKISQNGQIFMTKNLTNLASSSSYNVFNVTSLDLDSQNNIYVCGFFHSRLKLHPTDPNFDLISGRDSFLLKLNNSGDLLWAKKFDINTTNAHFEDIDISNDGNINMLLSKGDSSSLPQKGINILKIDSNNGNIIWQKELLNQLPLAFHKNNNDEMMIIGSNISPGPVWNTVGSIDVDPSSNTVQIQSHLYVLWLDTNGDFIDVKTYMHYALTGNISFDDITCDSNNNSYLFGYFKNQFDADPSQNVFTLNHTCTLTSLTREGFCIKLDSNRDFVNAFKFGSTGNCSNLWIEDLKVKNDEFYFVGNFTKVIDLDPTNNSFIFNSTNDTYSDGYMLKLGNCDTTTPLGSSIQNFCSLQNPTINDLTPNTAIIKWYNSSTSTNQLPNSTPLIDGVTYYASNQVGTCPESITRLEVTVNITQSPSSPIANNQSFCDNENATLNNINATGQNLTWYDINNNQISNNTILQNNTTYYVSQTINGCESNKTPVTVIVNYSSEPTTTSPQQFCIQNNASLNNIQITGQNILWYDMQTGGNLLPITTALQNGMTYYASQTINDCESNRVPVTITIQNTAVPTGNGNQSFCSTANATLSTIVINGSNIIWYDAAIGGTILTSSTLLANNTTYFATQTVNNCESPTRLAITISLINTLNATNYSESICDDLNNGFETINLTNYNSNLIASTGNVFSYYTSLNGAENQISSEEILNASNYNLTVGNHIIYVRIDSPNTCHQVVELNLTLFSKPILDINDVMPICEGASITISAGNGFDDYLWSTNETSPTITVFQPGNYSVTVSENHGSLVCSTIKNFTVVNSNIGTISEIITSDWSTNENTISVLLSTTSNGDYEYSLNGIDYQDSPNFTNLENGEYTVYVRDKNGCGITLEEVYLLMYPKYFTPNGDGYNDLWKIKFSENEPNLIIKIFDRYGKLIKQLGSNSTGWDGTYLGQKAASSDYWFLVIRENGKEHRGHFSLIR